MFDGWISIKEQLPEINQGVLLLGDGSCGVFGNLGPVETEGYLQYYDPISGPHFFNINDCFVGNVIAWKPKG